MKPNRKSEPGKRKVLGCVPAQRCRRVFVQHPSIRVRTQLVDQLFDKMEDAFDDLANSDAESSDLALPKHQQASNVDQRPRRR